MTFGDRLRRYRISRGLTLRQFADGTSISHATLGRIEHDGGDPADQHTRRAAKLIQLRYGVPADWLLYGSVPAQRKESAQVTHGYGVGAKVFRFPARPRSWSHGELVSA